MKQSAGISIVALTVYMYLRVLGLGWYYLLLSLAGMFIMYVVGGRLFQNAWAGMFSAYVLMLALLFMNKFGGSDFYIMSLVPFACLSLGQGIMMGFRFLSRMGTTPLAIGTCLFLLGNVVLLLRVD